MTDTKTAPLVGVFEDYKAAERAVDELRRAGFGQDQIGVIVRQVTVHERAVDEPVVEGNTEPETGAAVGAVTGGILGSLLGAAVALALPGVGTAVATGILAGVLGGATVGITGGGLVGGMIGMGLSESEAQHYEREFHSGRTLVTVQAGDRGAEAVATLKSCGALTQTAAPPAVTV
jgi:hypothetical protein